MPIFVTDIYGSAYLNSDDFDVEEKQFVIIGVRTHTFADSAGLPKEKIVLAFESVEKELPIGPQKAIIIAEKLGEDAETWLGKTLLIRRGKTMFGSKRVDCVTIAIEDF